MKYNYKVKKISKDEAMEMVKKYHYSNTLPKLNKHFIGFYLEDELVGVVTLGWGTRPLHTIKKCFPSLEVKDYYEIGRMCMTEKMPKNSESQMIKALVKWIKKNEPNIKVLFTWADGIMGKPGYVYQACNFLYGGFIITDIYLKDGIKIHPRQTKALFVKDEKDKRITIRPTIEQMNKFNIQHIKGKQFKYIMFLCDKKEKEKLMKESLIKLDINYPKEEDLMWWVQTEKGKYISCDKPKYKTDFDQKTRKDVININNEEELQTTIFDFIEENGDD